MSALQLDIRPEVSAALQARRPVVALESTLIAHGLPWPANLETARQAEAAVRAEGAVPATVAVWEGRPVIGLDAGQLERLARQTDVRKASSRDLAAAIVQKAFAATTVAATMVLAQRAGLRVFATGGIGGVHPVAGTNFDISADVLELARTPVAVVCAGAKGILDLAATLEMLETMSVPVVGYGTDEFPAFLLASSGLPVSARVDSPADAAALCQAHWNLGGAGIMLAQPLPAETALSPEDFHKALVRAESQARAQGVRGPAVTPFLLAQLAELTGGRTLRANQALIVANARLAARVAAAFPSGE
ncbi:MAG TPA: pseudouridine-5'-phosphate glycosidase [Gemmataceae bacterium]|nr:pseudouridine-5'-phosphate glycosidase [Gemmataceae bacterium]